MTKTKALYGFLCTLAVVAGLYPSIYLNVKPWWFHDRGLAMVQLVLTLLAAAIPLIILRFHWLERILLFALLLGVLRVSVGNGIESITLTRGEISSGLEEKRTSKTDWNTRIEKWASERDQLKAKFISTGDVREYTPTPSAAVDTARERRDTAIRERDATCKLSPNSSDCRSMTTRADTAQTKLEQLTQNYELTQRVDSLEQDIREAQFKLNGVVSPTDYVAKARDALEGAWFNPLQNREAWTAYISEGAAAFAPKIFVFIVSLLFAAALGEGWWKVESTLKSPPEIAESIQTIHPKVKPLPVALKEETEPSSWGLHYVDGLKAWIDTVRPSPGGPSKRYTASKAFPHYREFCEARNFIYCSAPTVLGTLIRKHTSLRPVARTGGQSHYELNLRPQLALVKTGGE